MTASHQQCRRLYSNETPGGACVVQCVNIIASYGRKSKLESAIAASVVLSEVMLELSALNDVTSLSPSPITSLEAPVCVRLFRFVWTVYYDCLLGTIIPRTSLRKRMTARWNHTFYVVSHAACPQKCGECGEPRAWSGEAKRRIAAAFFSSFRSEPRNGTFFVSAASWSIYDLLFDTRQLTPRLLDCTRQSPGFNRLPSSGEPDLQCFSVEVTSLS